MDIIRDRVKVIVWLTQTQYLQTIFKKFGMDGSVKPVSTPLAFHFRLSASMSSRVDDERNHMVNVPYANAIGALMYVIIMVSRYMHDPGKVHWMDGYVGIFMVQLMLV